MESPKYGEYRKYGCHWMGCSIIELSKSIIVEKYESDDLGENTSVRFEYITDGNFLKLQNGNKYYFWYSSSNALGLFGSYFLTDAVVYEKCKGEKECLLPKSYRFYRGL
jgi:hypothetical protein